MFLAVIVELADAHFRDFVLPCISPHPFGVDLIFFGNLFGSVILGDVEIVFCNQSLVRLAFEHQFYVGTSYKSHSSAESGCPQFILLDQLINVLTAHTHQSGSLRKSEIFLLFQTGAQLLHFLHMAQFHFALFDTMFVTSLRALRATIAGRCFLCDERFSAPLTNSFYFHIFGLFSAIFHEF